MMNDPTFFDSSAAAPAGADAGQQGQQQQWNPGIDDSGVTAMHQYRELAHDAPSRYENILVAPSDEDLRTMWIIYSSLLFIFTIFMATVFVAIVTNKKLRRNTFNMYLIFLMVPDLVFTGFCGINCAWLAISGGYRFPGMCSFQSFYLMFGMSANAWLNGIIAYELHKMLRLSNAGHPYSPPQRQLVVRNSLVAYAWAAFVALWGVLPFPWLPHKTGVQNGLFCTPLEFSEVSTIFFWTIYMPFLLLIPLVFCVGVTCHVVWRKLLPQTGRRRGLAMYFFRIATVFIVMWGPLLIALWVVGGAGGKPWIVWATGLWGHLQGPVSAGVSCFKWDIRKAVTNFVCSCCGLRPGGAYYKDNDRRRNHNISRISGTSSQGGRIRSCLSSGRDQEQESCDSSMTHDVSCTNSPIQTSSMPHDVSCTKSPVQTPFKRHLPSPIDFAEETATKKNIVKVGSIHDTARNTTDRDEESSPASRDIESGINLPARSSTDQDQQDEVTRREEYQQEPHAIATIFISSSTIL